MWRVLEIHKIIRTGKYSNCSTLAKEIEVTPKTIQRDVSFMRDQLGLPLEYHAIKHGYYDTQEVHECPMLHLSKNDLVSFFLARHALEPVRGTKLERMLADSFGQFAEAGTGVMACRDLSPLLRKSPDACPEVPVRTPKSGVAPSGCR